MTELKGTKIIAIDHGYGNIKTANTVTPTAITAYDSPPVFTGNILEYEGRWYRIGEGHKEFTPDKAIDEDYCGLPLRWVSTQRETFREYMLKKKSVRFKFNGTEYRIRITGCTVFPQGYPAIVRNIDQYRGVHMLADIGNGTMNIMYIVDKKPQEGRCWTEKLGVNQCMIRARNAVMDKYAVSIDESIVERILRFGTADISEKFTDVIRSVARRRSLPCEELRQI